MTETFIAFMLGGLFVYLATLQHTRFLERELHDAKMALYHRMGFKPERTSILDRFFAPKAEKPPEKRTTEDVPDLLELQRRAREED